MSRTLHQPTNVSQNSELQTLWVDNGNRAKDVIRYFTRIKEKKGGADLDEITVNRAHQEICSCKDVFHPGLDLLLEKHLFFQGFYVEFACSPWVSVGLL